MQGGPITSVTRRPDRPIPRQIHPSTPLPCPTALRRIRPRQLRPRRPNYK
jgi:hypothetical protein